MRSIDADALLGKFSFYDGVCIPEKDIDGFLNTVSYHDVKDEIRSTPTIEPPANWTPCSVGLPEKGVYVIGYLRTKEMKNDPMLIVCKYDESEGDDCFFDRDGWREDVVAWQPLPEPYRGGE